MTSMEPKQEAMKKGHRKYKRAFGNKRNTTIAIKDLVKGKTVR